MGVVDMVKQRAVSVLATSLGVSGQTLKSPLPVGKVAAGGAGSTIVSVLLIAAVQKAYPLLKRLVFRMRRQLAPLGLLGIGAAAGAVVSEEGIGRGAGVALLMAATTMWWLRDPLRDRPRIRRDVAICVASAAVWCCATSVLGFSTTDVVGVVVWAVLAIVWWRRNGVRRPAPVVPPARAASSTPVTDDLSVSPVRSLEPSVGGEMSAAQLPSAAAAPLRDESFQQRDSVPSIVPPVDPVQLGPVIDQITKAWEDLRTKRQNLKYVSLVETPTPFDHGVSATLRIDPGRLHIGEVQSELPWISSGLEYPISSLLLEQHPEHKLPKSTLLNPNFLRLQVVTRSPISDTIYFKEPCFEDGRIRYGLYADGCGHASYRLLVPNGLLGGFVLGSLNSGKSRLIELLVLVALWTRNVVVIYIDGQDGASSPLLYNHPSIWSGGPAEANEMLAALERGVTYRQRFNRAYRIPGYDPDVFPGILVVIDECHRIYTKENAVKHGYLAREGRKIGLAELAASQEVSVSATFGDHQPLRSSLFAGNAIIMRTLAKNTGQMVPGLGLSPSDFPALPGYGVVAAAVDDKHARSAPFRGLYIPDERDAAVANREGRSLSVPTVEHWFDRVLSENWAAELDTGTARAFGPIYQDRHEIAARRTAQLLADLESGVMLDSSRVVSPPAVPQLGTGGAQQEMSDRLLALPWDQYGGEMRRAQMFDELPPGSSPSTVASALRKLCGGVQPELEAVGDGVYRRKGSGE